MDDNDIENNDKDKSEITTYKIDFNRDNIKDDLFIKKNGSDFILEAKIEGKSLLIKDFACDFINIETNTKYGQSFNLILGYTDQYQKLFKKIVIPIFYRDKKLFSEKLFITILGVSAKTGDEEWHSKELIIHKNLQDIDIDEL